MSKVFQVKFGTLKKKSVRIIAINHKKYYMCMLFGFNATVCNFST
jgi:hypothetical protein